MACRIGSCGARPPRRTGLGLVRTCQPDGWRYNSPAKKALTPISRATRGSPIDTDVLGLNNPCMPRPEAAHRVKSYSAATGYVYQYYFYEVEKSKHGAAAGSEYADMVLVGRKRA